MHSLAVLHQWVLLVAYLGSKCHCSRSQKIAVSNLCGQEAELGLVDEAEQILNLLLQRRLLEVLLSVGVGSLGAGIRIAEARHVKGSVGEDALRSK